MQIKTALVEDNPHIARAVKDKLSAFANVEVLFVASSGQEAIQQLSSASPDVLLMDISMPVMDGIETTRRIRHLFPSVKVVMLTVLDDPDKIFEAILAGAIGYMLKEERGEKIFEALNEAIQGGAPMSPAIASKALQLIRGKGRDPVAENKFNLSERELQILELMSKGDNYHQIAEKTFISPKTVRKHIEHIYTKMQVNNKVEATQKALKNKLLF